MQDAAPTPEDRDPGSEPEPESDPTPGSCPEPTSPGLTRFLVDSPSAADVSREALSEAVRSLLRERDYLRRARDLQQADHESQLAEHRSHAEEAKQLRNEERKAFEEQADGLQRELAAHRKQTLALARERDDLLADRDAWRELAERSLWSRVKQNLKDAVRRRLQGRRAGRGEADARPLGDEVTDS
ncbi:MAG: hypothetical protein AAF682_26760 [Planctomycetota bacterium]